MKSVKIIRFVFLAAFIAFLAAPAITLTSCKTAPDQRSSAVTTLKVVGATATSAMSTAAQLLKDGKITVGQWQKIADIYDNQFQPTYRTAVNAVQMNLDSPASPDLVNLATQMGSLILQFTNKTP